MDVEPVSIIREGTRSLLKLSRRTHKDQESDLRRSLKETSITSEDISSIANKLKTKSAVTVEDLQILKNGLMNDVKNIEVFLNSHGALRGLVRELTGHSVNKQCAAAGAFCNLALGDGRACTTVAKAAGSYLVAALDNLTVDLAVTCAWTLGNLAGSGTKVCNVLAAQGAISTLSHTHNSQHTQEAAIYALTHFAYQMRHELRSDHLVKLLQTLSKLDLSMDSTRLLFILSCHDHFSLNMTNDLIEKLLKDLPKAIESHRTCKQTDVTCCKLVYIIRVIANSDHFYTFALNHIIINNMFDSFKSVLLSNNVIIINSLLWMLGNLFNNSGDEDLFSKVLS